MKIPGSTTRMENRPNERNRTIESSESRNTIGSFVPHLSSVNVCRLTKYTCAWKGDSPSNGSPRSLTSSGRLTVVRVWRPEGRASSALPSRKNTPHWLSCTMSCAPNLMAADPEGGSR